MTQTFPSLTELTAPRPFVPAQTTMKTTPTRCAELAAMPISALLYRVLIVEQKAAA